MLCCQCVLHLFISSPELIPTFKYFAYLHIVCRPIPGPRSSSCSNKCAPKRKNCVLLFAVIEPGGTSSALNRVLNAQINWESIEQVTSDLTFLFPRCKSRVSALVSHCTIPLVSPLTPSTARAAIPCSLDELHARAAGGCLAWKMPHRLCFQPDSFPHSTDREAHGNHKHSLELCPSGHPWPCKAGASEEMLPSFIPVEDGCEMYFIGRFTPKMWDWVCLPWATYKHILV